MIVDDEIFVRMGIASSVDWQSYHIAAPFQAANGREAWEIMQREPVDIVLTDIKMPEMDGLELIKKMRKNHVNSEVVILTCMNEFAYVQEAIKLGACDYLFKPTLLPDDILEAIKKVIIKVEKVKKERAVIRELKNKVNHHIPKLKQQAILDMIYGRTMGQASWENLKKELQINIASQGLSLIVLKADALDYVLQEDFEGDKYSLQFTIMNILSEVLMSYRQCEIVCRNIDEYIILISEEETCEAGARQGCHDIAKGALEALQGAIKLNVSAGISQPQHTIDTLKRAYDEAQFAIEKRFFLGFGSIVFYDRSLTYNDNGKFKNENLISSISEVSEAGYLDKITDIFRRVRTYKGMQIKDVMELSANIVFTLLKNVSRFEGIVEELYNNEGILYTRIYNAASIDEVEQFLLKLASDADRIIEQKYRSEVHKAIQFMEKHLGDADMSLESAAQHVNMSKNYFSKLFKEKTGTTFIDYLTQLRVSKAQELYMQTDLKVYQIAEQIGYSDWRYFSKVYKKQTGHSLSRFR